MDGFDKLLDLIAGGMSVKAACAIKGIPSRTVVYERLRDDKEYANRYTRACEIRADDIFDEMMRISDTPVIGEKTKTLANGDVEVTTGDMIEHRRLQIDARKWSLARMSPKKYGEKLAIGGADDLPPVRNEDVTPSDKVKARLDEIEKRIGAVGGTAQE